MMLKGTSTSSNALLKIKCQSREVRKLFSTKIKPQAGFKLPATKEGEEIIGFRPHGNTDIFSKPKNFNFEQQRQNNEQLRFNIVKLLVALSFIPIGYFVMNAEANFRRAQVKQLAAKRRERLDKEHGIDRDKWKESMKEMDEEFRITEKEEIQKYREVGKTAEEYYRMKAQQDDHRNNSENINEEEVNKGVVVAQEEREDGTKVNVIRGDNYE